MKNIFKYIEQIRSGNSQSAKAEFQESLFISAFPKSGSSFIVLVINDLLKFSRVHVTYHHLREQDLYEPLLQTHSDKKTISKHHTLATAPNIELFKKFQIKPVVLTRNLPDTVISLRDHISKTLEWPHFMVPKDFNFWTEEKQFDFLIDLAIPWYIFFYVSWKQLEERQFLNVRFFTYEDFHNNKAGTIKNIIEHFGYQFTLDEISESLERVNSLSKKENRVNKGVMDRGKNFLSQDQMNKIKELTKYYPTIDFSPIM